MMKRMGSISVMVAVLWLWASPAPAQVFQLPSNRQLISFVSFSITTTTSPEVGANIIASLANQHIEVHQIWLARGDASLFSVKLQQGRNGVFVSFDLTPRMPLRSFDATGTLAPNDLNQWPFSATLNMVPPRAPLGDPAQQQYWMRLESGTPLFLYMNGGTGTVYGFARFKYQPAR